MRNTIIFLLVFIILFSGCATVPAGDSGLLKTPCMEKLDVINRIWAGFYVIGEKSGAVVPVDHPDIKKLFSYDFPTANAYDEYLALNDSYNSLLIISSVSGLAFLTVCGIIFNPPSYDVEVVALYMFLPSLVITLGTSAIGLIVQFSRDGKRNEAFNLYGVSCNF